MANEHLDESFYEELFGEELNVTEERDRSFRTDETINKDKIKDFMEKGTKHQGAQECLLRAPKRLTHPSR